MAALRTPTAWLQPMLKDGVIVPPIGAVGKQSWDSMRLQDIVGLFVVQILSAMALNSSQQDFLSLLFS